MALDAGLLAEVANDCGHDRADFAVAGLEGGRASVPLYAAIRRLAAQPRPCEETVIRVAAAALGVRRALPAEAAERGRVHDVAARIDGVQRRLDASCCVVGRHVVQGGQSLDVGGPGVTRLPPDDRLR